MPRKDYRYGSYTAPVGQFNMTIPPELPAILNLASDAVHSQVVKVGRFLRRPKPRSLDTGYDAHSQFLSICLAMISSVSIPDLLVPDVIMAYTVALPDTSS